MLIRTSQEGVAVCCLHLKHAAHDLQNGNIEGTTTQIIPEAEANKEGDSYEGA